MTTEPYPHPSPEAYFEVAARHQDKYERIWGEGRFNPIYDPETRERLLEHHSRVAHTNALLAVAGLLAQQHICGHGTRGWCPHCHTLLKEGQPPA